MIFLNVPFREKDAAKSLGARWDAVSKRWYIPADYGEDISAFSRWLESSAEQDQVTSTGVASSDATANNRVNNLAIGTNNSNQSTLNIEDSVETKGINLSELMFNVQNALRRAMPGAVWVIAEIVNINERRGHYYFELSETDESGRTIASCRAMIWQSQAQGLLQRFATETGSELAIGQKVLVLAEASFHQQYGFSLTIQDIDARFTLGELEQKLNLIRQALVKKGVYLNNKKHALPSDFFRLAVIAPPEAAGLGDFRADADVLQQHKLCEFKYFYSSFQGNAVETEMHSALDAIESLHASKPYDAIVIIRGGGAKLDLSMLNIESVAERICLLNLPVLSGIGHERDNTIIDEVANTQFDTPSKVIAYIRTQIVNQANTAKNNWQTIEKSSRIKVQELLNDIAQLKHQISRNSQTNTSRWFKKLEPLNNEIKSLSTQSINKTKQRIETLIQDIESNVKQQLVKNHTQVEQLNLSINENAKRAVDMQKQQIIQSIAFILSSGPKSQLNRGFAIVKDDKGKPVTTAKVAKNYVHLEVEFADGSVEVSTNNVIKS